jgi:FAD/FMN-containing dehydrogenase
VLRTPDVTAGYCVDWTGRFSGTPVAVVRPGDVAEVSGVLQVCESRGVPVVPQGGNTGLVGGSVPRGGEVVLSLRRLGGLDRLGPGGEIAAGAGVTLQQLHGALAGTGWRLPIDFGSRDSATVGGMVATNAGGHLATRFGTMRRSISGLEWVGADGSIHSTMDRPPKDNRGYDLIGLLAGSEGTLGVITAARLRLVPEPLHRLVARVGCSSSGELVALTGRLLGCASVTAIEFMHAECLGPGSAPVTVLVELSSDTDALPDAAALLGEEAEVALDATTQRRLWAQRDAIPERIRADGVPLKFDVGLPLGELASFLDQVGARCRTVAPDARVWRFGHAGDGNVHLNVTGVSPDAHEQLEAVVFGTVLAHGGTISAEHGTGIAKAHWTDRVHTPAEVATMRAIKAALDPTGILNPGVILPTRPAPPAPRAAPRPDRS